MSTSTKPLDPYSQLPFQKNSKWTFTTSSPFTPTYVTSSLSLSSDPTALYNSRVKGKQIMLNNPAQESRAKKERNERNARRKKENERRKVGGIMGKKEARHMGIWKFDKSQAKFRLFLPLHHLWMGYMSELLGLQSRPAQPISNSIALKAMPNSSSMHPKLLKADFHGSIMTVVQSKNPCLIGLSGIVIYETENTFKVVTKEDELKVLPKQNTVFSFAVPLYSNSPPSPSNDPLPTTFSDQTVLDIENIQFQLYGNQFRFRSADRAGRKFKHKETIEL